MAQGHLIPLFHLAKLIEQRYPDYTITIVNTPLNIQKLQSSLPPNSNIHLIDLPFSSSNHGLPPNSENTCSLPAHQIPLLLVTTESLEPHFNLLISNMINLAFGSAAFMSIWQHLPHTKTDAMEFNIPGFPSSFRLHRSQLSINMRAADGSDALSIFFQRIFQVQKTSDAILCNTVREVELFGLQLLQCTMLCCGGRASC
ncbi:crocetin glucosyltransferase 3-like [Dioscorea cayenensis subsp. rotundata]|uniref:Crocetin glucosyltransferase 3-like n=1 Tax=Dioscorea cayennensis subsp. rotundata TaxID=55577 RepID=A0AB40CFH5_DIOCR|nr:crocetin glucosyltransferase 3-like [Dioscorea cayenensis subsp. rotundata]